MACRLVGSTPKIVDTEYSGASNSSDFAESGLRDNGVAYSNVETCRTKEDETLWTPSIPYWIIIHMTCLSDPGRKPDQ